MLKDPQTQNQNWYDDVVIATKVSRGRGGGGGWRAIKRDD